MIDPRLARIQKWIGHDKVGAYLSPFDGRYGGRSANWGIAQFSQYARESKALGLDFTCVKFGQGGYEYYNGALPQIRDIHISLGLGMAPYIYSTPAAWRSDAALAIKCIKVCGGIILDCEDEYKAAPSQLYNLIATIRNAEPTGVIIVSGYGDPGYAFGGQWPMQAIKLADGYQPQTYFSYWTSIYNRLGAVGAINWGMADVANQFTAHGIDLNMPITPCMSVPLKSLADTEAAGNRFAAWHASVVLWHAQLVTAPMVASVRKGLINGGA